MLLDLADVYGNVSTGDKTLSPDVVGLVLTLVMLVPEFGITSDGEEPTDEQLRLLNDLMDKALAELT